jgi:predicted nucleotidyltransferase
MITAMQDAILDSFLSKAPGLKNKLKAMYLFGSRARGDEKPYSDYDLLLVVEKRDEATVDGWYDAAVEVLLETGKVISLKIFSVADFKRLSSIPTPFMARVLKEGVKIG